MAQNCQQIIRRIALKMSKNFTGIMKKYLKRRFNNVFPALLDRIPMHKS